MTKINRYPLIAPPSPPPTEPLPEDKEMQDIIAGFENLDLVQQKALIERRLELLKIFQESGCEHLSKTLDDLVAKQWAQTSHLDMKIFDTVKARLLQHVNEKYLSELIQHPEKADEIKARVWHEVFGESMEVIMALRLQTVLREEVQRQNSQQIADNDNQFIDRQEKSKSMDHEETAPAQEKRTEAVDAQIEESRAKAETEEDNKFKSASAEDKKKAADLVRQMTANLANRPKAKKSSTENAPNEFFLQEY